MDHRDGADSEEGQSMTELQKALEKLCDDWRRSALIGPKFRSMTKKGLRAEIRKLLPGRRKIGGKFHVEGSRIIKTPNGEILPEDEPLFLMRGRDYLAVAALVFYLEQGIKDRCTDYWRNGVARQVDKFIRFARKHPERMKQPGVTRGL